LLEALDRLSKLFPSIPRPRVILGCERSCPESYRCTFTGCYRDGVIYIRSDSGVDTLIHEYGHHIFHTIAGDHVDPVVCEEFARAFEYSLKDQIICERCGYMIIHDGSEGFCLNCGQAYVRDYSPQLTEVIGKGLLVGIFSGLLGGFITGLIPLPGEPLPQKIDKVQKLLAGIALSSLVSIVGYSV